MQKSFLWYILWTHNALFSLAAVYSLLLLLSWLTEFMHYYVKFFNQQHSTKSSQHLTLFTTTWYAYAVFVFSERKAFVAKHNMELLKGAVLSIIIGCNNNAQQKRRIKGKKRILLYSKPSHWVFVDYLYYTYYFTTTCTTWISGKKWNEKNAAATLCNPAAVNLKTGKVCLPHHSQQPKRRG